tara:strand:- start:181 stop:585 length:405 start_codon:yes stop_codon:yes gene_type:complete
MAEKQRLHKEDRQPHNPEDSFFMKVGRRIRWILSEPISSDYLFFLRKYNKDGELSREFVGRRIGRHPAQVGRYESMGYAPQLPEVRILRKIIIVLQANPITLLNLQLHFDTKEEGIEWLKSCCDEETRKVLDGE